MPALLHSFFLESVRRDPDRLAIDVPPSADRPGRTRISYGALDAWSRAIALRVTPRVREDGVVAVLLPRGPAAYAAQLGILRAGAAYTCLDASFPDARVGVVLADAGAVALVTDAAGRRRAAEAGWPAPVIELDDTPPAGDPGPLAPPAWLTPDSLAYLIYTSGTTGVPKAVAIEHRAIANLVADDLREFRLTPGDRVGQNSSLAYDSSVEELWLALAAGATTVVIDDAAARLGPDLVPFLRDERITVFCPPPTMLRATGCADPAAALPDLRLLYVGGEALPRDVADRWAPGRRLSNGYGPTECAVTAIRGDVRAGEPVSIGRPAANVTAFVLDDALAPCPPGVRGELCIGGAGLARGYWQRPELTAARFIVHPALGRLYRTGDLAHVDDDGTFFCHGRVDSQVKVRGYRVELDEIDAALQTCEGVADAASAVQDTLVAFVTVAPGAVAAPEAWRTALARTLPPYMVPARIAVIEALPRTLGGKLNRAALPVLPPDTGMADAADAAATAAEDVIAAAVARVLGRREPVGVTRDFFTDLGGDSLSAAMLVTALREDPRTASVAVRDVYEARTVRALAGKAPPPPLGGSPVSPVEMPAPVASRGEAVRSTAAQLAWLTASHVVASAVVFAAAWLGLPWLVARLGLPGAIAVLPLLGVAGMAFYLPLTLALAVGVKRAVIGRYQPMVAPVWGAFYLRHWIVVAAARVVPWRVLQGTVFHVLALRALGARIGRRVHIHRGVDLTHGGWDLLDIGDEAVIGQDATLGLVELQRGQVVVGPVSIGAGALVDVRAGVDGHGCVGRGAEVTALSSLPAYGRIPDGERWDGIPARPAGRAAAPPVVDPSRDLGEVTHGVVMLLAEAAVTWLRWAPLSLGVALWLAWRGLDGEAVAARLFLPVMDWRALAPVLALTVAAVPMTLALEALLLRALGRVRPGTISAWGWGAVRVWVKTGVLQSAGDWLSGTLFWPVWLRAAGMRLGRRCEISTIIDVVPELVTFGPDVFLADGIYLAGPLRRGRAITLGHTTLGARTFLGNHVVIPSGVAMPDDVLIGVSTVADPGRLRSGTSWFGLPPFELPRREVVDVDRSLTYEPSAARFWNRVWWEALRVALPVPPALAALWWTRTIAATASTRDPWQMALLVSPAVTLGAVGALVVLVLVLKWSLLGRVRPGQHPLWSCWCSRWDFLYVAWNRYASPALAALEGTLLLPWYLRAMGMRIGRGVVLGPGFAQVVDPDMLSIDDGATVHAMFQAHTFEDRVLKIDHVRIRRGATVGHGTVVLYGADIGEDTHVAPHSVVMKRETLLPGRHYAGAPVTAAETTPDVVSRRAVE